MEQSILKSTKKLVNVPVDDPSFDQDLVTHINSAFAHLHQLGLGPESGFRITGETELWTDFYPETMEIPVQSEIQSNIGIQVRMIFDPSTTPHLLASLEKLRERSDFRLTVWREEHDWVDPSPNIMVIDGGDPLGE